MDILLSPYFIIGYVFFLNVIIRGLEIKTMERNTRSLIKNLALLPAIILLWISLNRSNSNASPVLLWYLPLFSISFLMVMIVLRLLRFYKGKELNKKVSEE